jgi:hypothetical protein
MYYIMKKIDGKLKSGVFNKLTNKKLKTAPFSVLETQTSRVNITKSTVSYVK